VKSCPACNSRYDDDVKFCQKDGQETIVDKERRGSGADLVGTVIAERYRLIRKLGEGGMGEVYLAEHVHIEKRVALKLLRPEVLSNQEALTRFKQEARSASSIGHENIIGIDDFGTLSDGRVYLTMEFLEGAPLSDMIDDPLPLDRAINILVQTGRGLAAAHAKGIVHRDMKPENIYVTQREGRPDVPKILDFGIAKISGTDGNQHLTRTGTIFGTPFYMSPEQALGQNIDHRADIYAMGVIMYEVFTGTVPFKAESFMGILTQHITVPPPPPMKRAMENARSLPPELEAVILRAMAKKADERYQSMNEVVAALTDIYRLLAGPGLTAAYAAAPIPSSQFVPVPTSYVNVQSGPVGMASGPHRSGGPRAASAGGAASGGVPLALAHTESGGHFSAPPGATPVPFSPTGGTPLPFTPPSGMHITGTPFPPPSAAFSAVMETPKKSKAGLIIGVVAAVVLGAGGVSWYFIFGPGKRSEAAPVVANDPTPSTSTTTTTTTSTTTNPTPTPTPTPNTGGEQGTPVVEPLVEKTVIVLIDSVPRGADILVDGSKVGETPKNVTVPAGKQTTVKLAKRGYESEELVIDGTETEVSKKLDEIKKRPPKKPPKGPGDKPPPDELE
jgi:eukaryotic-like serine/threonine-protein kinase